MKTIVPPKIWNNFNVEWQEIMVNPWYSNIALIQDAVTNSAQKVFRNYSLISMFFPITTGSISSPSAPGSDSEPVSIDLLGVETFLADSMQFYLELACRIHKPGAYYIMQSFRGEKCDQYHLSQFYHIECEMICNLEDIMLLAETLVYQISLDLLNNYHEIVLNLSGTDKHLLSTVNSKAQFNRVDYKTAINHLKSNNNYCTNHSSGNLILTKAGEAELVRQYGEGLGLWLTNFPSDIVPFYQANELNGLTTTADLLLGDCEVIGAGQRHQDADSVMQSLNRQKVKQSQYDWYLQMKTAFPLKTSGFGLGLERFLLWVLQHDDIRDFSIIHRDNGETILP